MATEPIRNQIIEDILAAIKTISKANGFWFDVQENSVKDYLLPLDQIPSNNFPFISVVDGEADIERLYASRRDAETMDVAITIIIKDQQLNLRRDINRILQDVRIKLLEDTTRGALARQTTVDAISTDEGILGFTDHAIAEITATVIYDFPWTQP